MVVLTFILKLFEDYMTCNKLPVKVVCELEVTVYNFSDTLDLNISASNIENTRSKTN